MLRGWSWFKRIDGQKPPSYIVFLVERAWVKNYGTMRER